MSNKFIDQLKLFCAGLDRQDDCKEYRADVKRPEPLQKLYDIRKRSLPVGLDKTVVFGVTKSEARRLIFGSLKAKIFLDEDGESKRIIYYDVVPAGSMQAVYFNHVKLLKEGI